MRKLTSSGCTLLLVSHATDQILQFCERAIWLERGEVKADGRALRVVQAYEEFIERMRASAEDRTGVASSPGSPAVDFRTPRWQQEAMAVLLNGAALEDVSRWPGVPGLLIKQLAMTDAKGIGKSVFKSGEAIRIRILVDVQEAGVFPVRFALLFMTESGNAITRALSPYFELRSQVAGEEAFDLVLPRNSFTEQTVMFSVAAFKTYEPECPQNSVKYDLLARSFKFRIVGGTPNDPGIVTMATEWTQAKCECTEQNTAND
jgi:lipopolysaccharide transport system ATP-binding protein